VKRLEQTLAPKPPQDIWIRWSFPIDFEKPHGLYGYQDVNFRTREMKSVPEEEEIRLLRQHYEEEVSEHAKRQQNGYSWTTFEDFLKSSECKCERCQSLFRGKELADLLKEREEVFESLTEGMAPKEKAEFEHAVVKEIVNSEDFQKLLRDHEGRCQSKDKEVTAPIDDGK
jgi:hypothetical protein